MNIKDLRHPFYNENYLDWMKYRLLVTSGRDFIDTYLSKFSDRETDADFQTRRNLTYNPSFAAAAVSEVINAIYQRLVDIIRIGGPASYQNCCQGKNGGVDRSDSTMTYFIGTKVLPELLNMKTVGVFVDRPPISGINAKNPPPYLYPYRAEDILTFTELEDGTLTHLLLRDTVSTYDETTGLTSGYTYNYRYLRLTEKGVEITFYDADGNQLGDVELLPLPVIPFVRGVIEKSLLTDIADYQIALMNISSSDLNFILFANFPFYTEQVDPMASFGMPPATAADNDTTPPTDGTNTKIKVGATKGRRYAKNTERPGFIHPSSEPLLASMKKQEEMKADIRTLINLTIANLKPVRASADSKIQDDRSLEAGLSYIGLELHHIETEIAKIWAYYENRNNPQEATVKYPLTYSLKSDEQRLAEAEKLLKFANQNPSDTFRKAVSKEAVRITMGTRVSQETLETIYKEIDAASLINIDPDQVRLDHEAGLVGTDTASSLRGYPKDEVQKAKKDHAERLSRIAISQAKGGGDAANGRPPLPNAGDRGVKDLAN